MKLTMIMYFFNVFNLAKKSWSVTHSVEKDANQKPLRIG